MDNKIRVHELAKQLKSTSKRILEMLKEMGIENKSYMSVLEDDELQKFYEHTGFHSEKNTENSQDDPAARKIVAQKEQQTQGKSSGVIVRRIIVDNSSSDAGVQAQKPQGKNVQPKKRQSREAGSGLRSGYEVRTESIEDLYASDLTETKQEPDPEPKAAQAPQETPEPVKAAPSEPTVRRVKRVKKEDVRKPKDPEPVPDAEPETKAGETEQTAAQRKEEKFVFKQYEYSEVIEIELEEEPAPQIEMPVKQEPAQRTVRERKELPQKREPRENHKKASAPLIPSMDPAAVSQEVKRDYAGKMIGKQQERESDKFSKKDGRKETAKSAQSLQKDKYKSARKFVGEKIGVSEIYNDEYRVSYDVDHNVPKKGAKPKKDLMKKAREFVASQKTQPVIAVLTNVKLPESMTVKDFAERIKKSSADVIKKLMLMGVMANQNQVIDFDTAALIASEFNITAEQEVVITDEDILFDDQDDTENDETAVERPPVVVVMGHVDHGKTSLLDAIRKTSVTAGEAGGITQHIGAYQVTLENGRNITFLDTPGHEAFTAMRSRGALVTDIAILVVAADDGIMPQTVESINHAKAAGVSIIVAINKIDKEGANVERVKEQLTEYELVPEEWGGDVVCVPVSAKTGEGIDELLEMVLLTADVLELKANPNRLAKGTVIESRLDKGRGPIATLLVQNGTLKHGDVIIAGTSVGRVRAMINDKGMEVQSAGPCVPVEVTGLGEVPQAGDEFNAVENERLAKELVDKRKHEAKEEQFSHYQKVTLDNLFSQMEQGERKELDLVVKADVNGSVEAVKQSLEKLSNDEVRVRVIHGGVGAINRSDVMLAQASNAIIIGFNVRPDNTAKEMQAAGDVEIRLYRIIYDAIEDVEQAMKGMLEPKIREVALGQAEVREVYRITGVGTVAGCYVTEGKVARNALIRLVRDGVVLCEDKISSLKRFKDDQKEVAQGYECGIGLEKYNDIKVGDVFESFILEEYRD